MTAASSPERDGLPVVDWGRWVPRDVATLVFVLRGDAVLLIRKKRGLGAGKINAPGGRLEPGETPLAAALRELREEVGLEADHAVERGQLSFQFTDGYSLHAHVFVVHAHRGDAIETDEAVPLWTPLEAIPFAEMWADDVLWVPHLLAGRVFSGRFVFAGDTMLAHEVVARDA